MSVSLFPRYQKLWEEVNRDMWSTIAKDGKRYVDGRGSSRGQSCFSKTLNVLMEEPE